MNQDLSWRDSLALGFNSIQLMLCSSAKRSCQIMIGKGFISSLLRLYSHQHLLNLFKQSYTLYGVNKLALIQLSKVSV